ncbi:MAG TPA: hypothetical protein VIP56_01865, partial [Nitrososphaeraceae archaeon]
MALYTSAVIKDININLKSEIGFSRLRYLLFTLVPLALLSFIDPTAAQEITTTTTNSNGLNST